MTNLPSALESGRLVAAQTLGQRDLQACAAAYGQLFASEIYDGALFTGIAGANTFSAPWSTGAELRLTNRAALWAFAVDDAIDSIASSTMDVSRVVDACLTVAGGGPPSDNLTALLADLRTELIAIGASPRLYALWGDILRRTLEAMAREWEWMEAHRTSTTAHLPSVDEYIDNAYNLCVSFVFVCHWISTDGWAALDHVDDLMALCRLTEQFIRLVNDLATYDRDVASGDLNVIHLGVDRDEVSARANSIADQAHAAVETLGKALGEQRNRLAVYLDRQIGFNMGFYRHLDYWGGS